MRLVSYLALATCIGAGGYWFSADGKPTAQAPMPAAVRSAKIPTIAIPVALRELALDPVLADDELVEDADEPLRGLDAITDPAEFAMVFVVDGVTYLRLSTEERATERGTAEIIYDEGGYDEDVTSVVAAVSVNALPPAFRGWANRQVLVDGECEARVVGFAEVSRVSGVPDDPVTYDEDGNAVPSEAPEDWTAESVTERGGVTLAARLDHCEGSWARAADWEPPALIARVEAPALEHAAQADLFAQVDDELTASWKEQGGEGTWREHATIETSTWEHPVTNERWIFVQAAHPGSCGEPSFSEAAVYRASAGGTPRFAGSLDGGEIQDVIDIDGDGQPELLVGGGDARDLVDLTNQGHDSISIPSFHYGCGC